MAREVLLEKLIIPYSTKKLASAYIALANFFNTYSLFMPRKMRIYLTNSSAATKAAAT